MAGPDNQRVDEAERYSEDPFFYLRAAIITLGAAAGIAAVVWRGVFNSAVHAVLSLVIFPVVLGVAFLLVYLIEAVLRSRYASEKGIVVLSLLTILLLIFPVIYLPNAPLGLQIQRFAIIPFGVTIAVLADYFIVRWLDRHPTIRHPQVRKI